MELNLARGEAALALIRAFEDSTLPVRARVDLAEALFRLYVREHDPTIFTSLVGALDDVEPKIRVSAAQAMGSLAKREAVGPMLRQLSDETDTGMQLELLLALEFLAEGSAVDTSLFSKAQRDSLTDTLVRLRASGVAGGLRQVVVEWLELLAESRGQEAHRRYLSADVADAESLLVSALEWVPDSKNINQKLGKLYYDSGDRERGLRLLQEHGMVSRAAYLPSAPMIDGHHSEAAWSVVEPLTKFYQCLTRMSAIPAVGRTDAYLGFHDQTLYLLIKSYEASTEGLVARVTQRMPTTSTSTMSWRSSSTPTTMVRASTNTSSTRSGPMPMMQMALAVSAAHGTQTLRSPRSLPMLAGSLRSLSR